MPIKKNSRIQYSIKTTFPFILPTLQYVNENSSQGLIRNDVRSYIVANFSQGKSQKSEMDIVSKVIDRYFVEEEKYILIGDLGTALLKTWETLPQTRNELLLMGFGKHFIVKFTLLEISNFLNNGFQEIVADDIKNKVRSLDIYPNLAIRIEQNVTEVLRDLIRLNILPEMINNKKYNIEFYKPTELGLLYYILYFFPDWNTFTPIMIKNSKLLNILLTKMNFIKDCLKKLENQNFIDFKEFADVKKYTIKIESIKDLNDKF